jgi:MAF protein
MQLILASSSPARHQLLQRLQIPFRAEAPEIDETPKPLERPIDLAYRLAAQKAQALSTQYPNHLIIGSDQVATLNDIECIGKPNTRAQAFAQLKANSGRWLKFYTGISVFNTQTQTQQTRVDEYKVLFRNLNDQQINTYLDREDVLACAGSFKSEGLGSALFQRHEGNDPTSLIGMPLITLCELLHINGIDMLN